MGNATEATVSNTVTMRLARDVQEQLSIAAERLHLQGPGILANVLLEDMGDADALVARYLEIVGR